VVLTASQAVFPIADTEADRALLSIMCASHRKFPDFATLEQFSDALDFDVLQGRYERAILSFASSFNTNF
jgi:hypothetical protein